MQFTPEIFEKHFLNTFTVHTSVHYKVANMAPEDRDFPTVEELIENPDIEISDDSDEVYEDALQSPESDSETTYENGTMFPGNLPDAEAYLLVSLLFKYC